MERQLKERLIGAAVLIAVAVIMVPEMFSGSGSRDPGTHQTAADNSTGSSESGQIKTYRIDLQHREAAASSPESAAQTPPVVPDTRTESSSTSSVSVSVATSAVSSSSSSAAQGMSSRSTPISVASSSLASVHSSAAGVSSVAAAHVVNSATGWSVQLGSFAAEATARQIVAATKAQGFAASLSAVKVGGKTLHRVRVGPFADREAAEAALSKLKHTYTQASLVAPNH